MESTQHNESGVTEISAKFSLAVSCWKKIGDLKFPILHKFFILKITGKRQERERKRR